MRSAEALGHNNLGALLYSLGDPGEALAHFEQARESWKGKVITGRASSPAGMSACARSLSAARRRPWIACADFWM